MGVAFSQFFPPSPTLTELNLPSQDGKIFIVTGGASGIGFELATILYKAGGKVYIAGRSKDKAQQSIAKIESLVSKQTTGNLEYLPLELDDLSSIKTSVELFKSKESKLDILWNNAGVSLPPLGSRSKQDHELQIATNCLGPLLFTHLLLPSLLAAAQSSAPGTVRVVWTSSQIIELSPPKVETLMADVETPPADKQRNYLISKIGNWFLANELANEVGKSGIVSVSQNPGNLNTSLMRHAVWMKYASYPLLHKAKFGAYTELWAGLSTELKMENNGGYVIPWGRIHPSPSLVLAGEMGKKENGENGVGKDFWDWCKKNTEKYM